MNFLFLGMRIFHVMFGAMWLGAAILATFFLLPAIGDAGPDGGKVMLAMVRRKFPVYIAVVSGLTVLTGLWLYWRFTAGFDPAISASHGGRVFGAGGLLGLIASVLATSGVTRNMKRAVALMGQAAATTDAGEKSRLVAQAGQHRQRAGLFGRIVAIMLIVVIMLMAVGHYV